MSHSPSAGHDADAHDQEHHVISLALLVAVFVALLFLTVVTVGARYVDFGDFNLAVALLIAIVKTSLVVLFFMHLYWDSPFNALAFIAGMFFVFLFIGLSIMDSAEYKPLIDDLKRDQAREAQVETG